MHLPVDLSTRLGQLQCGTFALTFLANTFSFFGILTPNWQVAEDVDAHRSVSSGLWIYCPGSGLNCWYIFSDDLINYYEKVDVCRFLLIYDCRQKLIRTPYFFGWHYAVFVLMLISLALGVIALAAVTLAHLRPRRRRVATLVLDIALSLSFLAIAIALGVFVINAEMLESRYLIGVNNTYPKSYGFSFYLAAAALMFLMLACLLAVLVSTSTIFGARADEDERRYADEMAERNFEYAGGGGGTLRPAAYSYHDGATAASAKLRPPPPPASPSDASTVQTRTFISY